VSVLGPPRLYLEPLKLSNFDCNADPDQTFHSISGPYPASKITIYAPMIYRAPCIMFWVRAYPLLGQVGGGLGPGIREFFGSCEMASSR
jgi:hypothetical protein